MLTITQGTVISGVRSDKYKGVNCYAIVINARCDLAQGKVNKIYYLIALPLEEWILSSTGFSAAINKISKDCAGLIKQKVERENLSWEDMSGFSVSDFNKVIDSTSVSDADKNSIKFSFHHYSHLTSKNLSIGDKKKIINENRKHVSTFLVEMSNGKNQSFLLLPNTALMNKEIDCSIIVDLKEVDYIDFKHKDALLGNEIDNKNIKLSMDDKTIFDKKFFVFDAPGFAAVEDEVESPWIEYIVQHFANAFTRVGVDNISKEQIDVTINSISKE